MVFDFLKEFTYMDFEGQKRAEKVFQIIIVFAAIVGFGVGYVAERYSYAVATLFASFLLSCLVAMPNWPCYRLKSLPWQPARDGSGPKPGTCGVASPKQSKKKN